MSWRADPTWRGLITMALSLAVGYLSAAAGLPLVPVIAISIAVLLTVEWLRRRRRTDQPTG